MPALRSSSTSAAPRAVAGVRKPAPGGIPDYCARFSKTMAGLASRPYAGDQFEPENVARVMASWGKTPTADDIAKKSRWRDERLAALVAHKRGQKDFEG